MFQKPALTHPQSKTSQNGLYPKLAGQTRTQEDLTETRLTTPGHPLASKLTPRTHLQAKPTLVQPEEKLLKDLAHSKIKCKEDKA
jgi:hypothetical protein